MADRSDQEALQRALDCARRILDGRIPPTEGARTLAADLLPALGARPDAGGFAESFAAALTEWTDHPPVRSRVDERIRHVAWRLVVAWR